MMAHSKTQEDYKAISQNVMHSTTGITDQFYSNMDDDMKKKRIDSMFGPMIKTKIFLTNIKNY